MLDELKRVPSCGFRGSNKAPGCLTTLARKFGRAKGEVRTARRARDDDLSSGNSRQSGPFTPLGRPLALDSIRVLSSLQRRAASSNMSRGVLQFLLRPTCYVCGRSLLCSQPHLLVPIRVCSRTSKVPLPIGRARSSSATCRSSCTRASCRSSSCSRMLRPGRCTCAQPTCTSPYTRTPGGRQGGRDGSRARKGKRHRNG